MKGLKRLKEVLPQDPRTLNNLGVVYYHHGMYEDALKMFKLAWYKSGYKLEVAKNNLETLAEKLNIDPAEIKVEQDNREENLRNIETLIIMGKEEEADRLLREFLEKNPNAVEALKMAAVISKKLGKYEDAVEYSNRILSISPDDVEIRKLLAESYYNLGKLEEALKILNELVSKTEDSEAYFLMSFVYGEMGDYEKAEWAMSKAYEINPNLMDTEGILSLYISTPKSKVPTKTSGESSVVLAKAYLNKGLIDEAMREVRKVKIQNLSLKSRREYDFIRSALSIIKGNYDDAIRICEPYRNSIKLDRGMLKLGAVAFFQKGDVNSAVEYLKIAYRDSIDDFLWLIYQLKRRSVEIPEPQRTFSHLFNLSVFLLNEGKFNKVLEILDDNRPFSRILKARAYMALRRYEEALKEVEGVSLFDAMLIKAYILYKMRRYDEMLEFTENLRFDPKDLRTETFLVDIPDLNFPLPINVEFPYERYYGSNINGVERAINYGNIKAALKVLNLSLRFSKTPKHLKYLGIVSAILGKTSISEYFFENLYRKRLLDAESLEILGVINERKGRLSVALSLFNESLKKGNKYSLINILRVLVKTHLYELAYKFYTNNTEHLEGNVDALFWLGEVMLGMENFSEAESIGRRLIEMGDNRGYLLVGESLFKKENYKDALENLMKVKSGYAKQKSHFIMGNIYAIMGNYEEATIHWEMASEMHFDKNISTRAGMNLQDLKKFFLNLKK